MPHTPVSLAGRLAYTGRREPAGPPSVARFAAEHPDAPEVTFCCFSAKDGAVYQTVLGG